MTSELYKQQILAFYQNFAFNKTMHTETDFNTLGYAQFNVKWTHFGMYLLYNVWYTSKFPVCKKCVLTFSNVLKRTILWSKARASVIKLL